MKKILLSMMLSLAASWNIAMAETAIFAGGCFWCSESDFEKVEGVQDVVSGYIGGHINNPTYEQVSGGKSGHIEAVKITYDEKIISYDQLLHKFWRTIDPTNDQGQFCDFGPQYRPAVFYLDDKQHQQVKASLQQLDQEKPFKEPVKVDVIASSTFYLAEDYHQDYYKKNPIRYKYYRFSCGRDGRIEKLWGKEAAKS